MTEKVMKNDRFSEAKWMENRQPGGAHHTEMDIQMANGLRFEI